MILVLNPEPARPVTTKVSGLDTSVVGFEFELPEGLEIQVRPRSGLAAKHGVTVLNSPGTIDSDYRGEISVILHNEGRSEFFIKKNDRIAQLIIAPIEQVKLIHVESLDETKRGAGGFGSTGK